MSDAARAPRAGLRVVVWLAVVAAAVAATVFIMGQRDVAATTPRIALVTADGDPYWDRVIAGAEDAAEQYGIELVVERADGTVDQQNELLLRLSTSGFDGIAVSPVDPPRQRFALREVSIGSNLVTVDSDSELSNRLCFVGADNYAAGRSVGELIKQALPDGARVLIVMGPIEKRNGERRRQGIIDELLDRSYGPGRPVEPLDQVHGAGAFVVSATAVDPIDPAAAEANVVAALAADPAINCVVGLFAYSTPAALRGIEASGRDGVTVMGFDDDPATLEGVADGRVYAAIVQNQYDYGFFGVRLLADVARGNARSVPFTERMFFPPLTVTAENVDDFRGGQR